VVHDGQRPEHHPPQAHRQLTELPGDLPAARLLGIDHVQLAMPAGMRAEREAEHFYGEVLGLRRVPKPPQMAARGGCWFQGLGVDVHLGVEEPFAPARRAHPALVVDDLDHMTTRVRAGGGEVEVATDHAGRRAHTHDPFGNRVELIESREPTDESFHVMADHAIFPQALIDERGVVRWMSASVERFFGWRREEIVGQSFDRVVAPESIADAVAAFAAIDEAFELAPWGGVGFPVDLVHGDGTVMQCEISVVTTKRTGLPWYVVNVRRVGYERALDLALGGMAEGARVGDVLTQLVGALERMVPESATAVGDRWSGDRFGLTAGSAAHLLVTDIDSPWGAALRAGEDVLVEGIDRLPPPLAALAHAEGFQACWVHPIVVSGDPAPRSALVIWRRLPGPPSRFTWTTVRRLGQLLRLTLQWDRSHRTLKFAATHDPLTGLANRVAFNERLELVLRGGEDRAAVLFLDLDHFKPVNEDLGHPVGDRVLTIVADRLVGALRPGDLVARIGGDEFAVLCERLGAFDDVEAVAKRLLAVVREPITPRPGSDVTVRLDASIGITSLDPDDPAEATLARVDEAMREAKTTGRGRFVRYRT
jgi:diguanylate cyclase (GGDEF)-like protein/PAS domain S-box-containing protein